METGRQALGTCGNQHIHKTKPSIPKLGRLIRALELHWHAWCSINVGGNLTSFEALEGRLGGMVDNHIYTVSPSKVAVDKHFSV